MFSTFMALFAGMFLALENVAGMDAGLAILVRIVWSVMKSRTSRLTLGSPCPTSGFPAPIGLEAG
jgi:hypothetical protein